MKTKRTRLGWARLRLRQTKKRLADVEDVLRDLQRRVTFQRAAQFEITHKNTGMVERPTFLIGDTFTLEQPKEKDVVPIIYEMGKGGTVDSKILTVKRIL